MSGAFLSIFPRGNVPKCRATMAWLEEVCNDTKSYRKLLEIIKNSNLKCTGLQITLLSLQNNVRALRKPQQLCLAHTQSHHWKIFYLRNTWSLLGQRFRTNWWWGMIGHWGKFAHFPIYIHTHTHTKIYIYTHTQYIMEYGCYTSTLSCTMIHEGMYG